MGESVTQDDIMAEIVAYLDVPDYYADGWRQTRDIAISKGVSVEKAGKLLEKAVRSGRMEKLLDGSRRAWWRKKLAESKQNACKV